MRRSKYVIDANIYIAGIRDVTKAREIAEFSLAFSPCLYLSSVVAQELLVGANPGKRPRKQIEQRLVGPFAKRGRIITPSHDAWLRTGRILAKLDRNVRRSDGEPLRSSFWNDVLIATSCREAGVTVITANLADFEKIAKVFNFSFCEPWPA